MKKKPLKKTRRKRRKRAKPTFEKWLRTLNNEIIASLAGQWRRDMQRTSAIQREFRRRLKLQQAQR